VRKLWIAVLFAALAVVAMPARADANHTLAHKVKVLQGKVASLQRKMSCLRRTGASTYIGYPYYEGIFDPNNPGPYPIHSPSTSLLDSDFATNFDQAVGVGSPDYWLLTLNNTRSCRARFPVVRNPYVRPLVTRAGAMEYVGSHASVRDLHRQHFGVKERGVGRARSQLFR
jgi:hypothetical protein